MDGHTLIRATECLCGINLLIQGLEFWRMRQVQSLVGPWAWRVQGHDVPEGALHQVLDFLFTPQVHALHLILRIVGSLVLIFWGSSLWLVACLWLGQVALMIRWRGAFNGGSDFMTQVVLSGMLMAQVLAFLDWGPMAWAIGLGWIAVNATTSYVIAGWVKWLQPQWRDGSALPVFLDTGLHGPLPPNSLWRRPWVSKCASWSFMGWEASFPLAFISVEWALVQCTIALFFHLLVFRFFGLNRFVWAWLASYPAILWGSVWVGMINS